MLERIVRASIRYRTAVIAMLALLLVAGGWGVAKLPVDALPDVSTIQVSILTTAGGLTPVEIERTVTTPVENALNGTPGSRELRSTSRAGLSAVTVIFDDSTDVWFARQLVLERLRGLELPPSASTPELAPVSTGLGEIFQFVVRSDTHTPMQLRTMLDWDIVPRLRNVPGVIEVNTMGGELKQFQVVVDPIRMRAFHLSLDQIVEALRAANVNVGGGYIERREEAFNIRGQGILKGEGDIAEVVIRTSEDGTPVLIRHLAEVRIAPALRHGVITREGKGEAVTGIVMMLLGANSRDVVRDVGARVEEIRKEVPPGVHIDVIYDRADFVGRTITTVVHNLLEGVLVVTIVLVLFLGTLRGALAVVLGVPAAMSVAVLGMHAFHVTGDLMSLGAIDFGFLVDGPIVVLEAVIGATAGKTLAGAARAREYGRVAGAVARPVGFAVAIIMLVYVPLLSLEGVEGKMFRPMAVTMACALFGALVYAILFFPALLTVLVPPMSKHGPRWMDFVADRYSRFAPSAVRYRWATLVLSVGMLVAVGLIFGNAGAEFVPRIFEGDAVVTIRRAPSISLSEARKLDLQVEDVLRTFPETMTSVAMTGRAEVAIDPVGYDNTDILVRLKPIDAWKSAQDFDALSELIKNRIESKVAATFVSVSQPIEDKTNELISGSRADVQVQIFGSDLFELTRLSNAIAKEVRAVSGTGDVRVERILGQPIISAVVDRQRLARFGVRVEDALSVLRAAREGIRVGSIYEQHRRFDLRVLEPPMVETAEGFGALFVETQNGKGIPLREVTTLSEGDGPTSVRREDRQRAVRVDVNLRGRDLVSWVTEARSRVTRSVEMPPGYHVEWGGQFENFERASARLAIVIPIVVGIIFGMLLWMFGNLRFALAVFALVPLSLVGGMIGLLGRDLSFSLPAAVGFIALGGIGVLNGVIVATEVRKQRFEGLPLDEAIATGTSAVVRAVLTTAVVAALGFSPMALATGAGAEVQRPLATVVVIGMFFSTILSLVVLPGILRIALRGYEPEKEAAEDEAAEAPMAAPVPSGAE